MENILATGLILEPVPGMKNAQIVDVLNVALLKVQGSAILLRQKMQGIKRLRLRLGDWWNIGRSRLREKAREIAARILDQNPLRRRRSGRLMIQQGPVSVRLFGIAKPNRYPYSAFLFSPSDAWSWSGFTHPSTGQSWDSVWIKSGLVRARILYTCQLLEI